MLLDRLARKFEEERRKIEFEYEEKERKEREEREEKARVNDPRLKSRAC